MKCPRCGNEVQPEERFCGQCGAQRTPFVSPLEKNDVPKLQSGRISAISNANKDIPYSQSRAMPSQTPQNHPLSPDYRYPLQQSIRKVTGPEQRDNLQYDASRPIDYSSGKFVQVYPTKITPLNGLVQPVATQYMYGKMNTPTEQQFNSSGYHAVPSHYTEINNQEYTTRASRLGRKQPHSAVIITICICLIIALVSIVGLLSVNWQQIHDSTSNKNGHASTPIAPTQIPTTIPSSTNVHQPDSNFIWCDTLCAPYGFATEYPSGWTSGPLQSATGLEITNMTQSDALAIFKIPTPVNTTMTTETVLNSESIMSFSNRPGYVPPMANITTTISGETWKTTIIYYQGDNQKERVEIYATIHNSKAYIIDLQAPDIQFDIINTQYFTALLHRYQFV